MNGSRSVKEKPARLEKSSPWVGFVQLGIICATIIAVVWIVFGGCQ